MTQLNGFFSMRTPQDLLDKLESDFNRLRDASPTTKAAQYAAFDFFVCAEHLPDWAAIAAGQTLPTQRSYCYGALVSHVANGAKHFRVTYPKHKSTKDTTVVPGAFQSGAFQSNGFQVGVLVVELEDGTVLPVMDVAKSVLSHWQAALK